MRISEIEQSNKEQPLDPRFKNPRFCEAVKVVLDYLGMENKIKSFKKCDKEYRINWTEFARNIKNPKRIAVVEILCFGQKTGRTLLVEDDQIDKKKYIFLRWW